MLPLMMILVPNVASAAATNFGEVSHFAFTLGLSITVAIGNKSLVNIGLVESCGAS